MQCEEWSVELTEQDAVYTKRNKTPNRGNPYGKRPAVSTVSIKNPIAQKGLGESEQVNKRKKEEKNNTITGHETKKKRENFQRN